MIPSLTRAAIAHAFALAYGEDFDVALETAKARAQAMAWGPDQGHEVTDFAALTVESAIVGANARDYQPSAEKLLARTFVVLAKQDGYEPKPNEPAPASGNQLQSNLWLVLGAIVIIAEAAVIAYCIYRASQVVTALLATRAADRELMRAHEDAMKVIDAHAKKEQLAGHAIPYDAGELAVLEALRSAQDAAANVNASAIGASEGSGVVEVGGGVVIGLGIAAVALYLYLTKGKR